MGLRGKDRTGASRGHRRRTQPDEEPSFHSPYLMWTRSVFIWWTGLCFEYIYSPQYECFKCKEKQQSATERLTKSHRNGTIVPGTDELSLVFTGNWVCWMSCSYCMLWGTSGLDNCESRSSRSTTLLLGFWRDSFLSAGYGYRKRALYG